MMVSKEGALYRYPDYFVQLLDIFEHISSIYHIDRQIEGVVVRAHADKEISSIPDYSTINRRINKQTEY